MNLKPEIELIKQQLDEVEDEKLLKIIREMLAFGKVRSQRLKTFSEQEYLQRYDESVKSIETGNVIAQEEVVDYFKRKRASE